MGFLDSIGQRKPDSRPTSSQPFVAETLMRNDAAPAVRPAPASDSLQTNRIHPVVIWSAALVVVAAVAVGAWLGLRHSAIFSPAAETPSAEGASAEAAAAVQPTPPKQKLVRPQAASRPSSRAGKAADAASSQARDEASEAGVPLDAPVNQVANLTEATAAPLEAVSDPIGAALLEDDYVYSSEGGGVVAPRLTSLGFVRRLVTGLRVRTSTIELVVSKNGTVERAKIFSTPAHWEDALILSRAKMFQFVPAYRNGFPVRYRFVMDVDTSP
jgi:pyruvate/2-oxoglutarate dehydrogenase complex dihydrolipoamide acyltransferase (E2) component